jgi:midasin (ATPase involved in ribosome maturation)
VGFTIISFVFSSSVLDRLNGLLEPDSVLTLNERGVIDEEMPIIEPHPDFRGVEVYILGEVCSLLIRSILYWYKKCSASFLLY